MYTRKGTSDLPVISGWCQKFIIFFGSALIWVGEEPDMVFLKKLRNHNQVKMIWINPFSCVKDLRGNVKKGRKKCLCFIFN